MCEGIVRKAMDLLALREHSKAELINKLNQKGHDATDVKKIVERLATENIVNDVRYAESFVNGRVRRGNGPHKIVRDLRVNGVEKSVINEVLAAIDVDWVLEATKARGKRFGTALPSDFREQARQSRFLERRGFTIEHIRECMRECG